MGVACAVFNVVVCCGVPVGALVWLLVHDRRRAGALAMGALAFLVAQPLLRLPLLAALQARPDFVVFSAAHPVAYAVLLAVSAAVFEEVARLAFLLPQRRRTPDVGVALAFGLGHGGVEALLIGINSLALLVEAPSALNAVGASVALAGVERVGAMAVHVACSAAVYVALVRRRPAAFAAALGLHAACDLAAGLVAPAVDPWAFELVFVAAAVAVAVCALRWAHRALVGEGSVEGGSAGGRSDGGGASAPEGNVR